MLVSLCVCAFVGLCACLCLARGAGGKFAAGEDFVPQLPMERYMNETIVHCVAGAAGAGSVTEIDTGLTVEAQGDAFPLGQKWVLFGGIYQPSRHADMEQMAVASTWNVLVTLLRGQWALADVVDLPRGDDDVVARGGIAAVIGTEHGAAYPLPLDRINPTPVLHRHLTVALEHSNHAAVNASEWDVTLFWGWAALNESDKLAIMQSNL